MTELKPCPFCSAECTSDEHGFDHPQNPACLLSNASFPWFDGVRWNTRALSPSPDLRTEAEFLCARLREFAHVVDSETAHREFYGHVAPSLARLEAALATPNAQECASCGRPENRHPHYPNICDGFRAEGDWWNGAEDCDGNSPLLIGWAKAQARIIQRTRAEHEEMHNALADLVAWFITVDAEPKALAEAKRVLRKVAGVTRNG